MKTAIRLMAICASLAVVSVQADPLAIEGAQPFTDGITSSAPAPEDQMGGASGEPDDTSAMSDDEKARASEDFLRNVWTQY